MNTTAPSPSQAAIAAHDPTRLDLNSVQSWMSRYLDTTVGPLSGARIEGGQSNPTWLLRDGQQAWVLRAKPAPQAQLAPSAHAIEREYRILQALQDTPVPVPRVNGLCEDESVAGVVFYVMEYVGGRVLRDVTLATEEPTRRREYFREMNRTLVALHQIDWRGLGLQGFGREEGYFSRLIKRWTGQYRASVDVADPAMENLAQWLPGHIPEGADEAGQACITHGDFRLENLMFHPTGARVVAVLDWELATLGHPLGDLAYNCLSWHLPTGLLRGLDGVDLQALQLPTQREHLAQYCNATGRDVNRLARDWPFYIAFNLFRLGAILQGIAHREKLGLATNSSARDIGALATTVAARGWDIARGKLAAV